MSVLSDTSSVLQMQTYVNKGELLPDEIVSKVIRNLWTVSVCSYNRSFFCCSCLA